VSWRLITIRPSHYNEKARWALDRFELAYDEEPWMPMLHMLGTARVLLPRRGGDADRISSRLSTPVLVTEDRVLADSSEIMGFASRHADDPGRSLYWSTEVVELDRRFSGQFGADTRRVAYQHLLPDRALFKELARRSVGPAQARAFITLAPVIRKGLIAGLKIEPKAAARSSERVLAEFARVDEQLADGRPYLCGDRFSAADISFASLASLALLVQPGEGYGAWLPSFDQVPGEYRTFAQRLRSTRAGEFALRMFAEERGRRVRPCMVARA